MNFSFSIKFPSKKQKYGKQIIHMFYRKRDATDLLIKVKNNVYFKAACVILSQIQCDLKLL